MKDTETLDRLYLEWSQFTGARTERELGMLSALRQIAASMSRKFPDPAEHANWCIDCAHAAVAIAEPPPEARPAAEQQTGVK